MAWYVGRAVCMGEMSRRGCPEGTLGGGTPWGGRAGFEREGGGREGQVVDIAVGEAWGRRG